MSRIELDDTIQTVVIKMADGNPGAMSTMIDMINNGSSIDPLCQPIMHILQLDEKGIYGTDIYILYNDKCDRDVGKLMLLMRGEQLGILPNGTLAALAEDQERSVPVPMPWADLLAAVKEKLRVFNYEVPE